MTKILTFPMMNKKSFKLDTQIKVIFKDPSPYPIQSPYLNYQQFLDVEFMNWKDNELFAIDFLHYLYDMSILLL